MKIDVRLVLQAANIVLANGEKCDGRYTYRGLYASTDYEGYNVELGNDYATVCIHFHSRYSFEYANAKEAEKFLSSIASLVRSGK